MSIGIIGNDEYNKLIEYGDNKNKYLDESVHITLDTENDSHALLCRQIAPHATILDVGCGQGIIGNILKNELSCECYGIEFDGTAAVYADNTGYYRRVFQFDIEKREGTDYNQFVSQGIKYDAIVCSDLLEHLLNPGRAIIFLSGFLKKDGKILISIPNIAHGDIIYGLFQEKFNYSEMGILDNTHLRFFTKYSFAEYIDSINKKFNFNFDCKFVGRTQITPDFLSSIPELRQILFSNEQLLTLQNLFVLKLCDGRCVDLENLLLERVTDSIDSLENFIVASKKNQDEMIVQEEELRRLIKKISYLENKQKYQQKICDKYRDEISAMQASRSWRLTKPLRDSKSFLKDFHDFITFGKDDKASILFFVHTWRNLLNPSSTSVGGTTLYVLDIIHAIRQKTHCYVLTIIENRYALVAFYKNSEYIYDLGIDVKVKHFDGYDADFYTVINEVIRNLQIDLLHINHIIDFPCDLHLLSKNIPTIMTIHDYTLICPKYFLLNQDDVICENFSDCKKCFPEFDDEKMAIRHNACQRLLDNSNWNIFPDDSMIDEFERKYRLKQTHIMPHGLNKGTFSAFTKNTFNFDHNHIDIAFVGSIDGHKGGDIVWQLIRGTEEKNITYHFFGITGDKRLTQSHANYVYHGGYNKQNIPYLLNNFQIDLVLFLNQCKESFSYTLSEALYAGIPCLAFNVGAIGRRLETSGLGWTMPVTTDIKDILSLYQYIFQENVYKEKKEK